MKHLRIVFAALLIMGLFVGSASAAEGGDPKKSSLSTELSKMLSKLKVENVDTDETVYVSFLINNKKEIVVLSTSDSRLDTSIKYALNYKPVKSEEISVFKKYTLPITFNK